MDEASAVFVSCDIAVEVVQEVSRKLLSFGQFNELSMLPDQLEVVEAVGDQLLFVLLIEAGRQLDHGDHEYG